MAAQATSELSQPAPLSLNPGGLGYSSIPLKAIHITDNTLTNELNFNLTN